ncbi:MAG: DUF4458 domain-containing protein [Alistipes sp.]|nr:DUF4458 domain-containing protein [Alistipes sp.]
MKLYRNIICVVLAVVALAFVVSCSKDEGVDNRERNYGYAQFKLYKEASYTPAEAQASRAVQSTLEYLADAHKVKVTLVYDGITIAQTLTLSAADASAAEWGLRSDKLKLLVGDYRLISFSLYDAEDELIYNGTPSGNNEFQVVEGGLTMHDITVSVRPRGQVKFTLKKDFSSFDENPKEQSGAMATRAATREYTFDEIKKVDISVARIIGSGSLVDRVDYVGLPTKFSVHFDEDDDQSDAFGYQTSTVKCDTTVLLPAGNYRVTSYRIYDADKKLLEANNNPARSEFSVADNTLTEASVKVSMFESDEYIKDYYALYEIWKSLDGENWYYKGENFPEGSNWDFNKDADLWGDQPGVELHSNGRVARIDISDFAFRGDLSPAIGQLDQLVELYLGTHNDNNLWEYDPSLAFDQSLLERGRNRMENHRKYLQMIHPATQMTEPLARGLKEKGISIPAISLYEQGLKEKDIFDLKSGEQKIRPMDTHHGVICNGLKSLPEEIGNLTNLEYFYIANSEIESLPATFKNLESLTDIEIYNCPKMKQFPMVITELPELISLNISNNKQWEAEDFLEGMRRLASGPSKEKIQILYARQNNLPVLPREIKNMKKIGLLDLAYNKIASVEEAFGEDIAFVQLYLDFNQLESLPENFCGMHDVETISVKYNKLKKVPNIFSAKSKYTIKSVDFSGNEIDGFEGENDGTFKGVRIETFTLANNKFKKYPKCLAETNSLISYIILRGCGITEIPKGSFVYKNSVDLMSFDLSYNNLSDLPREMHAGNLPYLYGVELSFNSFSKFPFEPLDAASLTILAMRSQRDAEGKRCLREWPEGIGMHTGLRALYLGSNDLRRVEDTISPYIYYLDISDNPNIIFDASDICDYWRAGVYFLIYDKSQNILNCDYMLE